MNVARWAGLTAALMALWQATGCAPLLSARGTEPEPVADIVDSLTVDPVAQQEFDSALQAARWRWLRALDESAAGRWDGAREELDQAFYTLAAVDDNPYLEEGLGERDVQAEVDAVAASM